jgi:hypothetical protein
MITQAYGTLPMGPRIPHLEEVELRYLRTDHGYLPNKRRYREMSFCVPSGVLLCSNSAFSCFPPLIGTTREEVHKNRIPTWLITRTEIITDLSNSKHIRLHARFHQNQMLPSLSQPSRFSTCRPPAGKLNKFSLHRDQTSKHITERRAWGNPTLGMTHHICTVPSSPFPKEKYFWSSRRG